MKKTIELFIVLALLSVFIFLAKDKLAVFYYNRGNDYCERHLYKEAINYFNKSLKVNPSFAIVHYGLANAYLGERLEDRAIEEYKQVLQLDHRFAPGYKALAQIYLRRELYQKAMDILKEAGTILPGSPEIGSLTNRAYLEYTVHLLDSGVDAFYRGDKLKAYELLNKTLQVNPDYALSHYLLGYFYYFDNKYDESETALKEAIRLDDKFFFAYRLLGDIYFEKKNFNKAIEEYDSALTINRNDVVILNNIGLAYMHLENYKQATSFLAEASGLNAGNVNIRYNLASLYRDSGRLNEATSEYKNVINMQPGYPGVHNDLGDIYTQLGRKAEASEEYRKEIRICQDRIPPNPDDPFVLNNMSRAYNGIGEYNKAKELIDKALSIKSDYQEAYLTLANICKNLGSPADELAALKKAKGLSSQKYFFIEKNIGDIKEARILIDGKR